MTNNLPVQFQPQVLSAHMEYAKALAVSDLLPQQYRGKPANLLWAISYGETLGVAPLTAVQSIHVINGRPTASADLIAGLVRRAGHKLRVNGDDRKAVAQIIRADDPDFTFEAVWTIERAQNAKLVNKDTWKNFPAAMLKARAITEVARAACSEILQGTIYTPEELGANVDQDGVPVDALVTPLRRVSSGEADPWTAPAPQPAVQQRDYLAEAQRADSAEAVRKIYRDAAADGYGPGTATLTEIAAIGKEKAAAEAPEPATDDGVVDVEIVDDAAAAEQQLRATAAKAGLDNLDEEFERSFGLPINQAGVQQLTEMTQLLGGAAA